MRVFLGTNDAERRKHYPDTFQAAIERLGDVPADEVLVIGDTPLSPPVGLHHGSSVAAFLMDQPTCRSTRPMQPERKLQQVPTREVQAVAVEAASRSAQSNAMVLATAFRHRKAREEALARGDANDLAEAMRPIGQAVEASADSKPGDASQRCSMHAFGAVFVPNGCSTVSRRWPSIPGRFATAPASGPARLRFPCGTQNETGRPCIANGSCNRRGPVC